MPLYEYRCTACGHTIEVIQRFSDRPLRKCKECSGRLEKLISRTSFHLKGGGWYVNDYSGSKASSTSAKGSSESTSSESPSSPSSASPSSESSPKPKHSCGSGCSH
jgi:putative FmdB family regulatory protein